VFQRRQKGWIGIDLGTRTVKIAQMERAGSRVRLSRAVVLRRTNSAHTPPNTAPRHDSAGDDIRCALALDGGFSGRRAACVLPMLDSDLRSMSIPAGDAGEFRSMIASELASHLDGSIDDHVFDYWENGPSGASPPAATNVHVLSAKRAVALSFGTEVAQAGLSCEVLDGVPLTLTRALQLATGSGSCGPVGLLDWGYRGATFVAVSDGQPAFVRFLRGCGICDFVERVQKSLELTLEESEGLLVSHGLPRRDDGEESLREAQEVIANAGRPVIDELVEQISKSLSFLKAESLEIVPEEVWLFGGGATIRNATTVLAQKVGLRFQAWRLQDEPVQASGSANCPTEMLGGAAALSMLAWVQ
jgi:type IV pilus assembly protein PilM